MLKYITISALLLLFPQKTYQPGTIRGIVDYYIQDQKKDMESGQPVLFTDQRIMFMVMETVSAGKFLCTLQTIYPYK